MSSKRKLQRNTEKKEVPKERTRTSVIIMRIVILGVLIAMLIGMSIYILRT